MSPWNTSSRSSRAECHDALTPMLWNRKIVSFSCYGYGIKYYNLSPIVPSVRPPHSPTTIEIYEKLCRSPCVLGIDRIPLGGGDVSEMVDLGYSRISKDLPSSPSSLLSLTLSLSLYRYTWLMKNRVADNKWAQSVEKWNDLHILAEDQRSSTKPKG